MLLPKAAAVAIIALLASTCRATPSPTSIPPSTTNAGTTSNGAPEPAGRESKVGLNETTTEPVATPSDGGSRAADPVPVSASQSTKPSSDGSTTTILLSIAVGLAASIGAAIVIMSRRRSAQFQEEMNVASGKDPGMAIIDLPENYDHEDDQFSVHGLSTRGGSAYVAHGEFASSAIRSSNILVPRPYQQPPVSTPTRTMEDGVSYVDESLLNHTLHPHKLRVVDDDSPADEDAMMVLCTMTGGDSMRYLDTAHLLQSINSIVPLASTTESDTYIVGDDDDDMSEYDM